MQERLAIFSGAAIVTSRVAEVLMWGWGLNEGLRSGGMRFFQEPARLLVRIHGCTSITELLPGLERLKPQCG